MFLSSCMSLAYLINLKKFHISRQSDLRILRISQNGIATNRLHRLIHIEFSANVNFYVIQDPKIISRFQILIYQQSQGPCPFLKNIHVFLKESDWKSHAMPKDKVKRLSTMDFSNPTFRNNDIYILLVRIDFPATAQK